LQSLQVKLATHIIKQKEAKVKKLIDSPCSLKFIEMGIVEGASITLLNKTLRGNSYVFEIEGCLIAMRKEEAELIEVVME